jgi:pilus assembly protein CpaC
MTVLVSPSTGQPVLPHWLQLLTAGAVAALLMGMPDRSVAQTLPDSQPSASPSPRAAAPRPAVRRQAPQPAAAPQRHTVEPGDRSADELNRQFSERLLARTRAEEEARAAEEARRRESSGPGFFERLFGGSSSSPSTADSLLPTDPKLAQAVPPAEPRVAQATPPGTSAPSSPPQDTRAPVQAPPSGPASAPAPGTPDQLAQTPPQQPTPPSQPPQQTRPPVPIPPGQPTLITPPAPPPGVVPPPTPVEEARSRQFGRSAVVPTEQPSLSIDSGKGTIVKLKTPASTVFVANPDIADVQVKTGGTIYVFGKKPGETVLYAVDDQDRVLLNTVVIVGHPTGRVIGNIASQPGGSTIQATTVGGSVVLQGRSDNPAAIEQARRMAIGVTGDPAKVINNVALTGSNQVLLRVRIVEAQRETLKRLGINWESVLNLPGHLTAGLATPTDLVTDPITRLGSPAGGILFGRYTKNGTDIFNLIDLLATENMLTVLAEPNLTAMSGETASFLAGGEFPIVVPQGNNAFTVQFKQFGVSLAFTPTIHGNGRISLRAKPEVSQLSTNGQVSFQGFTIPALTVRRVDTTVELASGQSFAIAGLIQNNSTQNISKLPGLGELPILGALFRSDAFQRQESELVVIVTPYLVGPTNHRLATPADGFTPPTDADRYLFGRTNHPPSARRTTVRSSARAGGFMLE